MPDTLRGTPPANVPQARIDQLMAHPAISREIIVDQTVGSGEFGGRWGLLLEIRLPSYRSLPLACIERIGLTVGDATVNLAGAALRIENGWHLLESLPALLDEWWFILDTATLFVPAALAEGLHSIKVEIARVEPYITAGRFSFTSASTAIVLVKEPIHG